MKKGTHTLKMFILLLTLTLGLALGQWSLSPIAAQKGYADATEMTQQQIDSSAYARTLNHVQRLAVEAHPSGTEENAKVRQYILDEIAAMGYAPERLPFNEVPYWEFGDTTPIYEVDGSVMLENILVTIDAPHSDKGVLFVCHYDSTAGGPGAADDAIAVAAMLEAMQSVDADRLTNSLHFLFTDGEEVNLLGARHFVTSQPMIKEHVLFVVNFEARGNAGGLVLFETSSGNYELINHYKRAVSAPMALSLAVSVYKEMPNGTDFSAFLEAGYSGINLANVEGAESYHEQSDNFENLNRNTAAHYQSTVQALVDYAGSTDFGDLRHDVEGVFFPLGRWQVLVTSTAANVIFWVTLALTGCAVLRYWFKREASFPKLLLGMFVPLLAGLLSYGVGSAVFAIIGAITNIDHNQPGYKVVTAYSQWEGAFAAFLAVTILLFLCCFVVVHLGTKLLGAKEIVLGNLLLFAGLSVALQIYFPAAAYLLYLSVLLGAICVLLCSLLKDSAPKFLLIVLCFVTMGILTLGLFSGVIVLLFHALTIMQVALMAVLMAVCALLFLPFYMSISRD